MSRSLSGLSSIKSITAGTGITASSTPDGTTIATNTSATPTFAGITFGTGSTLNTYTYGSFTPGIAFGGSSTGITYSTQIGYYTCVGPMTYLQVWLTLTAKGSQTGNATITGIPNIAVGNNSLQQTIMLPSITGVSLLGKLVYILLDGGGNFTFYQITPGSGTGTALTNSNFSSTTTFTLNGAYLGTSQSISIPSTISLRSVAPPPLPKSLPPPIVS